MAKKAKTKVIKELVVQPSYKQNLNFKIEEALKPEKIRPKEIFEGITVEKKKKKKK